MEGPSPTKLIVGVPWSYDVMDFILLVFIRGLYVILQASFTRLEDFFSYHIQFLCHVLMTYLYFYFVFEWHLIHRDFFKEALLNPREIKLVWIMYKLFTATSREFWIINGFYLNDDKMLNIFKLGFSVDVKYSQSHLWSYLKIGLIKCII